MQTSGLERPLVFLLSRVPSWLYERLIAEAGQREIGTDRIVGAALERELFHHGEPADTWRGRNREEQTECAEK